MVYDWFTRSAAPEDGETPESGDAPEAAAPEAAPGVDQDALEWARQAYARLKAQQEADKLEQVAPEAASEPEPEPASQPPVVLSPEASADSVQPGRRTDAVQAVQISETVLAQESPAGPSLLEQAAAQRAQRQQELLERAIDTPEPVAAPAATATTASATAAPADEAAPQLGAFDDDFTWSAEVLAAQGRQ
ncbi:MAG: signal recognition particle-docking protein FtsY, partial [Synechococcaceae bacterium WBB_10_009]|nr:signal recognition particle-docking protein FtsY [Synechococcaceae bacterium WBB_10_009]